ncbi:hypothetical protein FHG87_017332 [Trinorchestia longiramus]|nr:hypothetical protein FHG87_017332 [Trinorchestia longiramus]
MLSLGIQEKVGSKYSGIHLLDGRYKYADHPILADPSCYTNSACGHVFVTTLPQIPANELFALTQKCGQTIQVDPGKSVYLLSHASIGCKFFPKRRKQDLWIAVFNGTGKIKITMTFINFQNSKKCNNFFLHV